MLLFSRTKIETTEPAALSCCCLEKKTDDFSVCGQKDFSSVCEPKFSKKSLFSKILSKFLYKSLRFRKHQTFSLMSLINMIKSKIKINDEKCSK